MTTSVSKIGIRSNLAATAAPGASDDSSAGWSVGSLWIDTTHGLMWRALSVGVGAAVWAQQGPPDFLDYVSGNWYAGNQTGQAAATQAADTLYCHPVLIKSAVTIQQLGVRVGVGVGSTNVKMGVYAHDWSTGLPGALLYSGNQTPAATSSSTDATTTFASNPTLQPGVYWLGSLVNGATQLLASASGGSQLANLMGSTALTDIVNSGSSKVAGLSRSSGVTYAGGLPNPAGAMTKVTSLAVPFVAFKVA